MAAACENDSVVGAGCEDQFEFALDGIERLHARDRVPGR